MEIFWDLMPCAGQIWSSRWSAPSGEMGAEARVWVQFILVPPHHGDLKITPPPSSLGLRRCTKYSGRLRPPPAPVAFLSDLLSSLGTNGKTEAWEENVGCPRSRSGNSQDSAWSSPPCSYLSLSVPARGSMRDPERLGPCLSTSRRCVGCAGGGAAELFPSTELTREVAEVSLRGGWELLCAVSAVCARTCMRV